MDSKSDIDRTILLGEAALDHLKKNRIPAYPRHYELWYTYVAGFNRMLNRTINGLLKTQARISDEEMQEVYDAYLSPNRLGVRIEEVGGRVADEINQLEQLIGTALSTTSSYGDSLKAASKDLQGTVDTDQIHVIIKRLVAATLEVEAQNRRLETQLSESKIELASLHSSLEVIRYESLTDQLTSLGNRKHFDQSLEHAIRQAATDGTPLSLVLADIDHFKKFNDTYGHQTGDQVLRLVGLALKQNVKGQDIACRYGGEEFAVILPNTPLAKARIVGEHIREAVASKELVKRSTGENLGRVTISIGVSSLQPEEGLLSLIDRADACLYKAKEMGRNRVVVEGEYELSDRSVA